MQPTLWLWSLCEAIKRRGVPLPLPRHDMTTRLLTRWAAIAVTCTSLVVPFTAKADAPGVGLTAAFEIEFLQMSIDHHYAALRITELAAGTDVQRNGEISPSEGTSPTPGFAVTPAKATLDDLKSMARRNNRMQREEILTLKGFLRDWYGIDYQPKIRDESRRMIAVLDQARPGADFNHLFYEVFSRHHYTLMEPVNACVTGSDLSHEELRRECRTMWMSQTADIEMMRNELKRHFGVADYQPFKGREPLAGSRGGPKGQHSGGNHGD